MRTATALTVLALATGAIAACTASTESTTSRPATTVSEAPQATSATAPRQTLRHLLDGSVISLDDSNRDLAITHGSRAELRLSDDYTWADPQIAGPGELVPVTSPDGAGYVAWELVTSGPGNLVISTTGVPECRDVGCSDRDLPFAISIAVRRP